MTPYRLIIMPLMALLILATTNAQAVSLRCGVRLITEGDPKAKVLAECGEPDHVQVWEEERSYRYHYHPSYYGIYDDYDVIDPEHAYGQPYRVKVLVIIEEWTYNRGPGRFMNHLRLENGIVQHITSGDYGY